MSNSVSFNIPDKIEFNTKDINLDTEETRFLYVDENNYQAINENGEIQKGDIKFIQDPKTGAKFPQIKKFRDIFEQSQVTRSISFDRNGDRYKRVTYVIPSLEELNKNKKYSNKTITNYDLSHFVTVLNAQNIVGITAQPKTGLTTNKILSLPMGAALEGEELINPDCDIDTIDPGFFDYLFALNPQPIDDDLRKSFGVSKEFTHLFYVPSKLKSFVDELLIPAIKGNNLIKNCGEIFTVVMNSHPFQKSKLFSNIGNSLFTSTLSKSFQKDVGDISISRVGYYQTKPVYAIAVDQEDFENYLTALRENHISSKVHSLIRRLQYKFGSMEHEDDNGNFRSWSNAEVIAIPKMTHDFLYSQRDEQNIHIPGSSESKFYPENVLNWCVENQKVFDKISGIAQNDELTREQKYDMTQPLFEHLNERVHIYTNPHKLKSVQPDGDIEKKNRLAKNKPSLSVVV